MKTPPPHRLINRLIRDAIDQCLTGDYDAAAATIERIDADCHQDGGIGYALQVWADIYTVHAAGSEQAARAWVGQKIHAIEFHRADHGQPISDAAIWTGRMIAARITDDPAEWCRLYEAAPERDFGAYVGAYVKIVADTIANMPPGWIPPPAPTPEHR